MGVILITGAVATSEAGQHLVDVGVELRVAGRNPQRLTDRWPDADAVELDVMRPGDRSRRMASRPPTT